MSKLKNKNTKSRNRQKSNISEERKIEVEVLNVPESQGIFKTPPKKFMSTLPNFFTSLLNHSIEIENQEPRAVIELLGACLGISDYKNNIAAFWFLDTLADQVLKYSANFDGLDRSIFVSWLAGEMTIIKERNPPRETFLAEMKELFCAMSLKIKSGESLLHWEELFPNKSKNDEVKNQKTPESITIKNIPSQRDSNSTMSLETNFTEINDYNEDNEEIKIQSNVPQTDANEVLRAITEATFEMYGGISRYALIQAAFVEPVEIHNFVLPFTLRNPRKIKQPDFNNKEQITKKLINVKQGKNPKEKKETGKSKKKKFESVSPPPPSLTEEEILLKKREYILPLMDSVEAQEMLQSDIDQE